MVGLANQVGEVDIRALGGFTNPNQPKGAMLLMDGNPWLILGIGNNDNTKDNGAKEEREWVGNGDQAQHMT